MADFSTVFFQSLIIFASAFPEVHRLNGLADPLDFYGVATGQLNLSANVEFPQKFGLGNFATLKTRLAFQRCGYAYRYG